MISMPDYIVDEVPMKVATNGQISFCGKRDDQAVYANFLLKVGAEPDSSDWDIEEIWMGEQKLSGGFFHTVASFFVATRSDLIWGHVKSHLPGILADAKADSEREANT